MFRLKYFVLPILLLGFLPASALGQERKIKPGDTIEIMVSEHDELNQSVLVNLEGKVNYPFLEGVPVDGLTLSRLRELLVNQLSRSLEARPFVVVRFAESYPITVTVLGQVVKPGSYTIRNTATLQNAIGEASGFAPGAQLSQIKLIRKEGQLITPQTVNLEALYLRGDPSALPVLKDGDTIVVPGNPLNGTVKVLGGVQKPGSFEVAFRMNVFDAIALGGGAAEDADLRRVKIIAGAGKNPGEAHVIDVEALFQADNVKNVPAVMPGDVVYVPKRKKNLGKFVGALRDLSAFASLYLLIRAAQ